MPFCVTRRRTELVVTAASQGAWRRRWRWGDFVSGGGQNSHDDDDDGDGDGGGGGGGDDDDDDGIACAASASLARDLAYYNTALVRASSSFLWQLLQHGATLPTTTIRRGSARRHHVLAVTWTRRARQGRRARCALGYEV